MDALLGHVGRRRRMVRRRWHVGQLRRTFGSRRFGRGRPRSRRNRSPIRRMETDVLVSFGAAQLARDVVDRVVVDDPASGRRSGSRRLHFDVLVSRRLSTGHFDVVAGALDPETRPWGRVGRLVSRSRSGQIDELVAGRRSSWQTLLFRLQLGCQQVLRRRVDTVTRRLSRLLTADASRQRLVMNRYALEFPRGLLWWIRLRKPKNKS